MNTISSIVIDSDLQARNQFVSQLQKHCPQLQITDQISSLDKAKTLIERKKPTCVFIDVKETHTRCFELLEHLHTPQVKFIITATHKNYALQALHASVFDYIVKPAQPQDLNRMYDRLLASFSKSKRKEQCKIKFSTQERIHFIDSTEIIMAQAESNYTTLFLSNNRKLFLSKTLKEVTNMLPKSSFLRIHNSYCVNLRHVNEYQKNQGGVVIMSNGKHATLSRTYKEQFLESFV